MSNTVDKTATVLGKNLPQGLMHISDVLESTYTEMTDMVARGNALAGLPTGFDKLDKMISGLMRGNYIILAARPGTGKSTLALNIARHISTLPQKKNVVYVSLEMTAPQLGRRLLSSECEIDHTNLVNAELSMFDWKKIVEKKSALKNARLFITDHTVNTVAKIKKMCEELGDTSLVIIDHMQKLRPDKSSAYIGGNWNMAVSTISQDLQLLAKDLDVPLLCLSQLNREIEQRRGGDQKPKLSDLRDSGSLEQDADCVLFLHHDPKTMQDLPFGGKAVECIIAKNRHGQTGSFALRLESEYVRFTF